MGVSEKYDDVAIRGFQKIIVELALLDLESSKDNCA